MFRSLLIANRAEIAMRVMRTCRRMGIRTIAVHSDVDRDALHVRCADEAYRIGPPPATESYLDQAAILRVAQESGAEAIHPGYGFLAENADFAERCIGAGLAWVGPPPAAMRTLGDKAAAKTLAERVGVPVLPGYHGADQDAAVLKERAEAIGFPVLIKASAGGGGRGMRVVERAESFADGLEAAQREARASFGDARVLIERYVARPRHVEVQIFGDARGTLLHLGERECSIQRRHQKLVEESPSPAVDAALRQRMGEAALALARAAGYANAGTVEFLLDEDRRFYFLEVNARLQVEHPVTELVTGFDLVQWQLEIAAGEPIAFTQQDVRLHGHAIEARLIAEDPSAGFLPSVGRLDRFDMPPSLAGVRVDTGFELGSTISPYYDSLLAKIVVHGADRAEALLLLRRALASTAVRGVSTNASLLLELACEPAFVAGDLHTGFVEEHRVVEALEQVPPEVVAAAVAARPWPRASAELVPDPWQSREGWRIGRVDQPSRWLVGTREVAALASEELDGSGLTVQVGDARVHVERVGDRDLRIGPSMARVEIARDRRVVSWCGRPYVVDVALPPRVEEAAAHAHADAGQGVLTAPMPGRIVKVHVGVDDRVEAGQALVVLEAMKMEHLVAARAAGVVTALHVTVGNQVQAGVALVELVEQGGAA